MRRLLTLVALALVAAAGCKVTNQDYCEDAEAGPPFYKSCSKYRASLDAKLEAPKAADAHDAGDVADAAEAGDAVEAGDAIDAPVEKKPFCTPDGGECAAMADGGAALVCDTSGAALRCVECVVSTDCKGGKPVCDTKVNKCVECVGTGTECPAGAFPGKPVCDVPNQKCVVCLDNSQCTGKTPICDKAKKECRPCAADSECTAAPGICVDWDGHCAQATEVVTLQGGAGCVSAAPNYCKASDAVAALSATRNILVVKGSDAVAAIDPPVGAAAKVLIVGQGKPLVAAGGGDPAGVHLTGAAEFYVRDLKISGGTVGIAADGAQMVHINRCTVTGNGKGGILLSSSSYDVTNTVIADNMAGLDPTVGAGFGGARLNDPPAGGTARFENNTVVNNKLIGISCRSLRDVSTNVVFGNVGGDAPGCLGPPCCGTGDPMLDATYHLTAGSPCIDKLTPTNMSVTTDIDGGKRPNGAKLDCGADELGVP
jgi:hypothetical protein